MSDKDMKLNKQQQEWIRKAQKSINAERLRQLTEDLTAIHSPTGAEGEASIFMVDYMKSIGMEASYQPVNELSGNCIGRIKGSGEGPNLMLYAPIDTFLDAEEEVDIPWVGKTLRDDMVPRAYSRDGIVYGLGSSNPKSMLCTLVEAANAIIESGAQLKGDLTVATCGGGMPWVVKDRHNYGMSSGVMYMLSHGVTPDYCLIFKPGDEVYYEHCGLCWFKVTVYGTLGYAGLPRGIPGFRSSIVPAADVIKELENWLVNYPETHSSAQIRPEGWIAAVRSGWPDKPAFPSAATEIYLDVRTNPGQTNASLKHEFDQVMQGILEKYEDMEAEWEMYVSCQASSTDPDNWIVKSAVRAWEDRHGKPYPGPPQTSGQTDAAAIRQLGIPVVRVGYPFAVDMPEEYAEGLGGMGVARISDLIGPCESVVYSAIDTCTRNRSEIDGVSK